MESLIYKLSLIIGALANLAMAVGMLVNHKKYRHYVIYYRARLFTILWLIVFAVGYLIHAALYLRSFWPSGAAALTVSYFHIGAICFCWGYIPLLNPHFFTRKIAVWDTVIYAIGLIGYWTTAMIWEQTTIYTLLPFLVFFCYCAYRAVVFYKTFSRVTSRLETLSYGSVKGFVRWMQASCDVIIFFGIVLVAISAFFPSIVRYITPVETLFGIGAFAYIVYSLSRYGKVVEEATRATENVAEIDQVL